MDGFPGTNSNDTFVGNNDTFTIGDNINGGSGSDTLSLTFGAANKSIATLTSVETVNLTTAVANNTGSINATNWTGVAAINVKGMAQNFADGNGVTGTAGLGFTSLQDNVKIGLDGVKVATTGHDAVYVSFADAKLASTTATLSLALTNVGATGAIPDLLFQTAGTDRFTKLDVNLGGTNNFLKIVKEATAGSAAFTEAKFSGSGKGTVSVDATNATVANLTTLDASANTGGVTIDVSASTKNVTATGGSGTDVFTLGNGDNIIDFTKGGSNTVTVGSGNNKVTGGAGKDIVISELANFNSNDQIALGEGTRDELRFSDVTTLNASGVTSTQLAALNTATGVEVIGTSGALTAVDANYFSQKTFNATGDLTAAVTLSNASGSTLILSGNGITAVDGDALTVTGAGPGQTANLELAGAAAVTLTATHGGAGNNALSVGGGVSTLNILSTTTATSTTGLTNEFKNSAAGTTATHTVNNDTLNTINLSGNVAFTVATGKTAGFTNSIKFDANAFTSKLKIVGSVTGDEIIGGTNDDTIRSLGGNDVINVSKGGANTVLGGAGADSITLGAGKDTVVLRGDSFTISDTAATAQVNLTGALTAKASNAATDTFKLSITINGITITSAAVANDSNAGVQLDALRLAINSNPEVVQYVAVAGTNPALSLTANTKGVAFIASDITFATISTAAVGTLSGGAFATNNSGTVTTANVIGTGTISVDTITGFNFGGADLSGREDKFVILDASTTAISVYTGTATALTGASLNAALNAAVTTLAANQAGIFTFEGASYLVIDRGANSTTFGETTAMDVAVKLVGHTGTLDASDFVFAL